MLRLLALFVLTGYVRSCYWNSQCPYQLYGSKTPYDIIRGDIRDHPPVSNCQAVSVWTLNRHGNRNPGNSVTKGMKEMSLLKEEIILAYDAGKGQLCAQDIDDLKKWKWNATIEQSTSYLTGTGYEELYDIGRRLGEKYPHLLQGTADQFYFRPTNEQRTVVSCVAFVHGLTEGTNLNVTIEGPRIRDDVIRPYENCDRYQIDVKNGPHLAYQLDSYFAAPRYVEIVNAVQQRFGINTVLTADNVYSIFEMCRFYRSWEPNLRSPWCAVFTDEDLTFLEYYDDVRHYHRNGYGSWVNENLGRLPMKDLYENFEAFVQGAHSRKFVSYFTHDTMMEMVFSALGLYKDDSPLQGSKMEADRAWRSSYIGAFSSNLVAVLNSCTESGSNSYRVQIFINEQETPLCPSQGCTWQEFLNKFQLYADSNLDFCDMTYVQEISDNEASTNSASHTKGFWSW